MRKSNYDKAVTGLGADHQLTLSIGKKLLRSQRGRERLEDSICALEEAGSD